MYVGALANEIHSAEDVSAPDGIDTINKNQPDPKDYEDGLYANQTFGEVSNFYSNEVIAASYVHSGCKTEDEEQTTQDYEDGIYATQTFGKFIGVYSGDGFSFVEVVSGKEPIDYNQQPEAPYPNYKEPDWVEEDEVVVEYSSLYIGAKSNEIFSKDDRSAPSTLAEIDPNQKEPEVYHNGIYSTQTFGQVIGFASNDIFSREGESGVLNNYEINTKQPKPQDYESGIYATQTFGKFIGIFSQDAFLGDVVSGAEPINYGQKEETPYPDYKDPEWVVEFEIPDEVHKESLYIGAKAKEIFVNEDVSAPETIEDINPKQNAPQEYEDGTYSTQTFGEFSFIHSNETDFAAISRSGCKTKDDEQIEQDYKNGIYATQTFSKFIAFYADDMFGGDVVAGNEIIDYTQEPETPYPNYREPSWVIEDDDNADICLDELLIGLRSYAAFANDAYSAPVNAAMINKHQPEPQNYSDGIYATQTFGYYDDTITGVENAHNNIISGYNTTDEEQRLIDFRDGVYASQLFGTFIGTFSHDIFFNESVAGVEPPPEGQKPETPYPNYKDPEWFVEEGSNADIADNGVIIGLLSHFGFSGDSVSAPATIGGINTKQPEPKKYKDGVYSIQTFDSIAYLTAGDDNAYISNISDRPDSDENQVVIEYKPGIYATQTFGKFVGTLSSDIFLDEFSAGGIPIPQNQKPEIKYPVYKEPEWVVEEIVSAEYLKPYIGVALSESYAGLDVSAPDIAALINTKQPNPQDYRDGVYASQTFDFFDTSYLGELPLTSLIAGCKSEDDEQVEVKFHYGTYATQKFGTIIGGFSDDFFGSECVAATDPAPQNQKPEIKYPVYKEPSWYVEEIVAENGEVLIGLASGELPLTAIVYSSPTSVADTNTKQPAQVKYVDGIYATQTFDDYSLNYAGDNANVSAISGDLNANKNQKEVEYTDRSYATQRFGLLLETYSDEEFGYVNAGAFPINAKQPKEKEFLGYLETNWFVEPEKEIALELLTSLMSGDGYANETVAEEKKEKSKNDLMTQ